jgi:hypothetical protein
MVSTLTLQRIRGRGRCHDISQVYSDSVMTCNDCDVSHYFQHTPILCFSNFVTIHRRPSQSPYWSCKISYQFITTSANSERNFPRSIVTISGPSYLVFGDHCDPSKITNDKKHFLSLWACRQSLNSSFYRDVIVMTHSWYCAMLVETVFEYHKDRNVDTPILQRSYCTNPKRVCLWPEGSDLIIIYSMSPSQSSG